MANLLDGLAMMDARAQSQPEKEALVQQAKHEDPPPPQRRLRRCSRKRSAAAAGATPTAGTKAGMMAATSDGTGSDNAWRRARGCVHVYISDAIIIMVTILMLLSLWLSVVLPMLCACV